MPDKNTPLFSEFAPNTYDEWRVAAEESLRGASFEDTLLTQTYEGFNLKPIYFPEDAAAIDHQRTTPGAFPYVRGTQTTPRPWLIAQESHFTSPEALNQQIRNDLAHGQTAINLNLSKAEGLTLTDFVTVFEGIDLTQTPLLISSTNTPLSLVATLAAYLRQEDLPLDQFIGCIGYDPLRTLVETGIQPANLYDPMAELTAWAEKNMPNLPTITVDSGIYHDSGANAVQEVAFALATGVSYIRAMQEHGLTTEPVAQRMRFTFAVGTQFFTEIAKLRAARMLWAKVVQAFGGDAESQKLKLHVRTAWRNKTAGDPHVNILRTTVEAFAGASAGCDSLQIAPFDDVFQEPNAFSRRIARNQHIILEEEVNLSRIIDPAGGSWYVESLTDQLAHHAWSLFQDIERQGGMLEALQSGFVQRQVNEVAAQRAANLEAGRDVLVGVNKYVNKQEQPPHITKEPARPVVAQRAAPVHLTGHTIMEQLIAAAQAGATLGELAAALDSAESITVEPLTPRRLAEPFENRSE